MAEFCRSVLPLCRYCVTLLTGAYLDAMYKQITFLLCILSSIALAQEPYEIPLAKQAMIHDVQAWVALQTNLQVSQVQVSALDRRLRVPTCSSAFEVSFPYKKSKKTVQVKCPAPNWSAYIGIKLEDNQPALMYTKAASTGDTIDANFVKVTRVSGSKKGVVSDLAALKGKRLVASVSVGQIVRINQFADSILVFQLKNDILKGDSIGLDDVVEVFRSSEKTSKNSLFPKTLLNKATAARDLRAKTVLSRRDLNIRHLVLMASQTIARGQKLNASNVEVQPFYGILPSDTLYALSNIKDMESIRTIRPNLPLRASDLRPSLMVKKGDSIVLSSGSGLLSITITMIALENGKLGQQINLLNPESNEKIRALITGSGRARSLQSKK